MDWEKLFARHILRRGYDYFLAGKVSLLSEGDDQIIARVVGSDEYDVRVDFDEMGDVIEMECDCPHALSGHHCKHMAAVLYEYYQDRENFKYHPDTKTGNDRSSEDPDNLVDRVDQMILRKFVNELIKHDTVIKDKFHNFIYGGIAHRSLSSYKSEFISIVDVHAGMAGFIDYREADEFVLEVLGFIDNNIAMLVEIRDYSQAFKLIELIIKETRHLEIDDSDGGTYKICEKCRHYLDEIVAVCDLKLKKEIYDWVKIGVNHDNYDLPDDFFDKMLLGDFDEPEFQNERLELVKEKLNQATRVYEQETWPLAYYQDKWALSYLELLERSRVSSPKFEEVYRKYWNIVAVRQFYVDKCIEKNDYAKAIEILHESQEIDHDSRHLVASYSVQLKDLYRKSGDKNNYISQLWQLALNDEPGNLDLYQELKSQYDHQEWTRLRDRILLGLPRHINIAPLLNEDKLYGRLMGYVYERPGLSLVFEYEQVLKPEYSRQILNKYALELDNMAQVSSNRGRYREMVTLLVKMKKFQGGEDLVNSIVSRWREDYRRRRAMMEELNQVFK